MSCFLSCVYHSGRSCCGGSFEHEPHAPSGRRYCMSRPASLSIVAAYEIQPGMSIDTCAKQRLSPQLLHTHQHRVNAPGACRLKRGVPNYTAQIPATESRQVTHWPAIRLILNVTYDTRHYKGTSLRHNEKGRGWAGPPNPSTPR